MEITYYIYKNKKPEEKAELNLVVKAGSLYEEEQNKALLTSLSIWLLMYYKI